MFSSNIAGLWSLKWQWKNCQLPFPQISPPLREIPGPPPAGGSSSSLPGETSAALCSNPSQSGRLLWFSWFQVPTPVPFDVCFNKPSSVLKHSQRSLGFLAVTAFGMTWVSQSLYWYPADAAWSSAGDVLRMPIAGCTAELQGLIFFGVEIKDLQG